MVSNLRKGFTTGSCAAAASKAAAYMLLTGTKIDSIQILTPAGITYTAVICDCIRQENQVSCAVIKDGGDDPDITSGAHIVARVWLGQESENGLSIHIDGGEGVGRVTKPGLDQPVGAAAINHVPRQMIKTEVESVCELLDYKGDIYIEISVPEGKRLAESTFNPRLGIVDGISIIGTSGIVEPMSSKALIDTIRVELNQKKALGQKIVAISPGNYGIDFMKATFNYDLDLSVKCSNFIGDTIDLVIEAGFEGMLLTGHIGKLIKVSGGVMNTHSMYGDRRMELLSEAAVKVGCDSEHASNILEAATTEEGVRILSEINLVEPTMSYVMDRICYYLRQRAQDKLKIEVMMYSTDYGMLAQSKEAQNMLNALIEDMPKEEE